MEYIHRRPHGGGVAWCAEEQGVSDGGGVCPLRPPPDGEAPWRIRSSHIALRDDKTLWFKASDREYIIASGYAPNEYVVVRGELEKPGGSGKEAGERQTQAC